MKFEIDIKLPKLLECDDYHTFDNILYKYRQVGIKKLGYKEVGCGPDGVYYAVMYHGKCPEKLVKALTEEIERDHDSGRGWDFKNICRQVGVKIL